MTLEGGLLGNVRRPSLRSKYLDGESRVAHHTWTTGQYKTEGWWRSCFLCSLPAQNPRRATHTDGASPLAIDLW